MLIINNKYSITIGQGNLGWKEYKNATTGIQVFIPDELYDLVKKIIEEQSDTSLIESENQSYLTDYEFKMNSNNKFVILKITL